MCRHAGFALTELLITIALLGIVTFLVLFPIYTTVVAALKPGSEVLENPLVPTTVTFDDMAASYLAACSTRPRRAASWSGRRTTLWRTVSSASRSARSSASCQRATLISRAPWSSHARTIGARS